MENRESFFKSARVRRELFYKARQETAEAVANANFINALKIKGFEELYKEWRNLPLDLARAELRGDKAAMEMLKARDQELLQKMEDLLQPIDITLEDFYPRRICEKCEDTGYDVKTGRVCDCCFIALF